MTEETSPTPGWSSAPTSERRYVGGTRTLASETTITDPRAARVRSRSCATLGFNVRPSAGVVHTSRAETRGCAARNA